jgi:hypothetical protein
LLEPDPGGQKLQTKKLLVELYLGSLELVELEIGDSNDSEDRQHHNLQKGSISSYTVMKVVVAVVVFCLPFSSVLCP